MCLIYIAHKVHPVHRLVVAANRDEFHDRASAAAHWWSDEPHLLAGRDLEAGGTWMGVTRCGRFAAITNFKEAAPKSAQARSRGELVSGFLLSDTNAMTYLSDVASRGQDYNGFSILVHDGDTLACFSNRGGEPEVVPPGVHGLSNHLLDSPWPKVEQGKLDLLELLVRDALAPEHMLSLLDERGAGADSALPRSPLERGHDRQRSTRFILGEAYGTRCSTTLLGSASGEVVLRERSYDRYGQPHGDAVFSFQVQPKRSRAVAT